jgi:NADH:ubiquinone oxidoreductase subunit E
MASAALTKDNKLKELRECIDSVKGARQEAQLIHVLHKAQGLYGYLSQDVMDEIATSMQIPTAHIWGVATFYHYFNLFPLGKHVIAICLGTACFIKGAGDILDTLKSELKVEIGQTSEDGLFTLQEARCLGACGLAPVMMIDGKIYGDLTPKKTIEILNTYRKAEVASAK